MPTPIPTAAPQQPAERRRGFQPTHGHTVGVQTAEYTAWQSMRARCNNPNHDKFKYYGGRGIKVCARWQNDFAAFLADMGPKPSPDHSLDRKEGDKDYSPDNCQWATRKQQARNKSNNHLMTVDGRTATMAVWAEESGIALKTIWRRKELGWSDEKAVRTPLYKGRGVAC